MSEKYFYSFGRRKTSVVTVRLFTTSGNSTFNSKNLETVYPHKFEIIEIFKPFTTLNIKSGDFHFTAKSIGGGKKSQLSALVLGLSRALVKFNPEFKKSLKDSGLLTRDARMVERKKPGLKKARKAEQYSKR